MTERNDRDIWRMIERNPSIAFENETIAYDILAAEKRRHQTLITVPAEPTDAMIEAGLQATNARLNIPGSGLTVAREKMRLRYKAMIAKADVPIYEGPIGDLLDGPGAFADGLRSAYETARRIVDRDVAAGLDDTTIIDNLLTELAVLAGLP